MKKQVVFIHGGTAFSNYETFLSHLETKALRDLPDTEPLKKWTGSLREDLSNEYDVFMPAMPNSQNAQYTEWKIWFERYLPYLRDEVILVGWSLGGYFLAKYLIENELPIKPCALLLVAAPFEPEDFGGEDGGDFAFDTTKVGALTKIVNTITIFHSKDDFLVPYEHALKYQAALVGSELVSFEDKNHFLLEEFPELLSKIREISADGKGRAQ